MVPVLASENLRVHVFTTLALHHLEAGLAVKCVGDGCGKDLSGGRRAADGAARG